MYLYTKDVKDLGFRGSSVFDSKCPHYYFAPRPRSKKIYVIDNFAQSISHFVLTKDEWEDFNKNELSLVPIGCCCATGGRHKENPIIDFQGDFKMVFGTRNKVLEFISKLMKSGERRE